MTDQLDLFEQPPPAAEPPPASVRQSSRKPNKAELSPLAQQAQYLVPMDQPENQATLARWVRTYGEDAVREALKGDSLGYFLGSESAHHLAKWEFRLFGPRHEICAGLGVYEPDHLEQMRQDWIASGKKMPPRPKTGRWSKPPSE